MPLDRTLTAKRCKQDRSNRAPRVKRRTARRMSLCRIDGRRSYRYGDPAGPLFQKRGRHPLMEVNAMQQLTDDQTRDAAELDLTDKPFLKKALEDLRTAAHFQGRGECFLLMQRFFDLTADVSVARELDRVIAQLTGLPPVMTDSLVPTKSSGESNPAWLLATIRSGQIFSRSELTATARREGRRISDHALSALLSKLRREGLIERVSQGRYRAVNTPADGPLQ